MITIYYTTFDLQLSDHNFYNLISLLPDDLKEKTLKFKHWQDAQAYLFGKLLLKKGLKDLGFNDDLDLLKYNVYDRPSIHSNIDFNTTHSGRHVVVVFSTLGRVGIDIEK